MQIIILANRTRLKVKVRNFCRLAMNAAYSGVLAFFRFCSTNYKIGVELFSSFKTNVSDIFWVTTDLVGVVLLKQVEVGLLVAR